MGTDTGVSRMMNDQTREHNTPLAKAHLSRSFYATKPTRWTQFRRTFIPWQMVRFAWINLKMMKIIHRSHAGL